MNPGRPSSYFFYSSFVTADLDLIADDKRASPENEDARKEVLQDILEGKSDCDRCDSESCNQIAWMKSRKNDYGGNKQAENNDKGRGKAAQQIGECSIKPGSPAGGVQDTFCQARRYKKDNKYNEAQYQIRKMDHQPGEELAKS